MLGDKNVATERTKEAICNRASYVDSLEDGERQRIASAAAGAFALQVLLRYGEMYLAGNSGKTDSIKKRL